jgi:hypothetical protein
MYNAAQILCLSRVCTQGSTHSPQLNIIIQVSGPILKPPWTSPPLHIYPFLQIWLLFFNDYMSFSSLPQLFPP